MASIKVAGDAVVITSELKLEDIRLVQAVRPKALEVSQEEDGKKKMLFRLGAGNGKGNITEYGIVFGRATNDGQGYAQYTQEICVGEKDIREYVAELFGVPVMYLNELEKTLPAVIDEIKQQHQDVLDSIEVL